MHGGLKVYRGAAAAARQYVEADRGRVDDYYLTEGTGIARRYTAAPDGPVEELAGMDGDAYQAWVAGRDPDTGQPRGRLRSDEHAVRFVEVIVNGPKSWSLAAELHPDVAAAYEAAQDRAAEQILGWLAHHATARVGPRGGQVAVPMDRLEAAVIRHYTSRAGDPHWHLHLHLNARVYAAGKWRGIDTIAVRDSIAAVNGIGHAAVGPELLTCSGGRGGCGEDHPAGRYSASAGPKIRHHRSRRQPHLDAVATYCEATTELAAALSAARLTSAGFLSLREYLTAYLSSTSFRSLLADTTQLRHDLDQVRYSLHIRGNHIRVRKYDGEPDYSEDVDRTFAKFKQHADKDYRVRLSDWPDMNHVEAGVLDLAAKLYPETFLTLETYCQRYQEFVDDMIGRFDREIQFYVAYLEYVRPIRGAGLKFCYPKVSSRSKEVRAYETFDIALARMLSLQGLPVVSNDFQLNEPERILVVSGPNQGGKTTLARTFGQLHYLARVGCPVPGRSAQLFLYDQLFTHFEKEEDIGNLRGKLQDDLVRIREILDSATAGSLIVINEIFDSTTLKDAVFLGREIMARIVDLDALCVYVTFIVELASVSETTVSMVSTVNPANPAQRTYKLMRRPADGLAYATAIAEKYGLTYDSLRRRIAV